MTFLIIQELKEMLNKAQLFCKSATTPTLQDAYTDLKSTLRILIAMEGSNE